MHKCILGRTQSAWQKAIKIRIIQQTQKKHTWQIQTKRKQKGIIRKIWNNLGKKVCKKGKGKGYEKNNIN